MALLFHTSFIYLLQNCIATHESNGIDIIIALILNDINPLGKKRMDLVLELKVSWLCWRKDVHLLFEAGEWVNSVFGSRAKNEEEKKQCGSFLSPQDGISLTGYKYKSWTFIRLS